MSDSEQNRINLEDNSDRPMSDSENKENVQEGQQETQQEGQEEGQEGAPKKEGRQICSCNGTPVQSLIPAIVTGGAWYSKPENAGNNIGGKVQGALNPVGKHAGPVMGRAAEPVGAVVGTVVGGIMKPGEGFGEMLGVGYGNKEGGPAAQQEARSQELKADLGEKEQTGDNPLGL